MMQRAGWLGAADADHVERYRAEHGTSTVEAVLGATTTDEASLAEFLRNKLMIPEAPAELLTRIGADVAARIPAALAWEHQVLPVSVDDLGNLTLAMVDPTDLAAVEAVAATTSTTIIRAVSAVSVLRDALEQHYGSAPKRTMEGEMVTAFGATERSESPHAPAELNAAPEGRGMELPMAWAAAKPLMLAAGDRNALTEALLQFGGGVFEQTILFVHLRDQLRGHAGRGSDLLVDAVPNIQIPMTLPSVFATVVKSGQPFIGTWPLETPVDRAFAGALGNPQTKSVLIPFRLRDKTPILMFGTGLRGTFDAAIFDDVVACFEHALGQLLVRRRASSQ